MAIKSNERNFLKLKKASRIESKKRVEKLGKRLFIVPTFMSLIREEYKTLKFSENEASS